MEIVGRLMIFASATKFGLLKWRLRLSVPNSLLTETVTNKFLFGLVLVPAHRESYSDDGEEEREERKSDDDESEVLRISIPHCIVVYGPACFRFQMMTTKGK